MLGLGIAPTLDAERAPDVLLVVPDVGDPQVGLDTTDRGEGGFELRRAGFPFVDQLGDGAVAAIGDLRGVGFLAPEAVEPARVDVGDDADEVRDDVMHGPRSGRGTGVASWRSSSPRTSSVIRPRHAP